MDPLDRNNFLPKQSHPVSQAVLSLQHLYLRLLLQSLRKQPKIKPEFPMGLIVENM